MAIVGGTELTANSTEIPPASNSILYLEGPMGSGKTSRLRTHADRLLDTVPAASMLVLCSNHARQKQFIDALLHERGTPLAQLPVYTYAGFVRNTLFNYWPLVEQIMASSLKRGAPCIRPELSGLEDSELMLRWLLARLRRDSLQTGQPVFDNFPGSDMHIYKQIVRRLRLRSENQLTRQQMQERSVLLDEMCRTEVAWLETQFDRESYILRVLDPNKQLDIFGSLMNQDNAMSQWLKRDIRHLIVDDVDETIPAQQRLIEFLAPSLDTLILAADVDGGSRRGYLNAYPYGWEDLKKLRPGAVETLECTDVSAQAASILLANWKAPTEFQALPPMVRVMDDFVTRVEMLEQVVEDVDAMLESGYQAGDLALILPKTDFLSFYQLQNRLNQRGIPVQLLSGTKRPSDNPKCKAFITLLQWANCVNWKIQPSRWEIKTVLMQALQLHYLPELAGEALETLAQSIADALTEAEATGRLLPVMELLPLELGENAKARYQTLARWLEKAPRLPFDKQLYSAFQDILALYASERDGYLDLNRIIQSYLRQREIYKGLSEGGGVVAGMETPEAFNRWWLEQVKSGSMADTPEMPEAVNPEALVIATPQKMIDTEVYRKVQCWLDVGSREWARSDNAPLYNAWVHSAVWDGTTTAFNEEFNESVIRARAGHITRTLMLLATEQVRAYASELDDLGGAQLGLLKPRLLNQPEIDPNAKLQRATLREDQAPVLKYAGGTMAISAVPGAGKTFVNVELLLELIERGVQPDSILVLTYMESAAKTLLGRLKKKLAGVSAKLPVVSTIHSLAFRILTENDHALLLGYHPDDMTILDDFSRGELLARVASATQPESSKNVGDWQRAIDRGVNHVKMFGLHELDIERQIREMPGNFRVSEFLPALKLYNQEMRQQGFLDFTDLITKAVEILQLFPDVREKYQQQFTYIIEDEAQDSSRLLQEFIRLLGGSKPNLIRTGDTNQSITTTFSSADTSVFRDFIKNAEHLVQMDRSGRCAPEVIALANAWIRKAGGIPGLEAAFAPVDMLAVPGQNPALLYAPQTQLFDLDRQEEEWLVERIQQVIAEQPDTSIAVLVRTNAQVNRVAAQLQQAKIPAVGLSDQLSMNPVFSLIITALRLIAAPGDLPLQCLWYGLLLENHLISENAYCKQFLAEHPLVYHSPIELRDELLKQWHYDFVDFGRQAAGGNISALIVRIVDRYCLSVAERSNGYLCALMAQDILAAHSELVHLSPLEIVIDQFTAFQRSWRGKKGFSDLLLQHANQVVQVMSIHKSKGQEFDVVFMPFMQAEQFPHQVDSIRFDESDKLIMELDRIVAKKAGAPFNESYQEQKKREKIEEEARLIYVGLTRAKRALYLSAHAQGMGRFNKLKKVEPAAAFRLLSELLNPQQVATDNVIPFPTEELERDA
jgi:DNA helicase-2/ATP-dependent DNA helicase PcrA